MNEPKQIDLSRRNKKAWSDISRYRRDISMRVIFYGMELYQLHRKKVATAFFGAVTSGLAYDAYTKSSSGDYTLPVLIVCAGIFGFCHVGNASKCPKCKTWFAKLSDPFDRARSGSDHRPTESGTKMVTKEDVVKDNHGNVMFKICREAKVEGTYHYGTDYCMCRSCDHTWKEGTVMFIENRG